ncbi:MAG: hypothetical protein EU530_07575 [Promethearchaeota archaeon]|nr:MAG: hypothetical protein EU530_07575 [Candidatus Lokiarchaeota archaeon]
MKRVYIYLISVVSLMAVTSIFLGLLGYYNLTISITLNLDVSILLLIIFGVALISPLAAVVAINLGRLILGLFKPKFIRIAANLERVIKRETSISYKLGISLRKEQVIDKMEHIWRKADMQYPLSELDFEKIMGGHSNA